MLNSMKKSLDKPSLDELLQSKSLSNPRPESWDDFAEQVKLKTLHTLHSDSHISPFKKGISFALLLFIPFFVSKLITSQTNQPSHLVSSIAKTATVDVENSKKDSTTFGFFATGEIEFVENSYLLSPSDDYERSFAMENFELLNDSLYTSPSLVMDNSGYDELSQDFTF